MAFIKRFGSDLKLIVLDDVLTTVDAGHRLRVARLLAGEFAEYQLIVTTHDRLWAEELKTVLPQAKLYHLKTWNLEIGATCRQTPPSDWDYYKQQAEEGRPQDAIAGAGRNLEKFLYQMRGNLGVAVPAKPGDNYMIGDLYGPFFKWVRRRSIERLHWPQFNQDVKAMDEELSEVWRLRNWSGAHFNVWAAHVTRDEALSFLSAVKNLVDAFACPVCHGLVIYNEDARALLCPYCQPAPPPRVVYQYQSDWTTKAARMLRIPNPKVRKNIVPMVQSAFARFMHDMRYQLLLPLAPAKKDKYDLPQLYEPFFAWAANHPLPDMPQWEQTLTQRKKALDTYWQNDQWVEVPDNEIETFVDAVQRLTSLFECATCSQLLDYDHEQAIYLCTRCNGQESTPTQVSAVWFVVEK